MVRETTFNLSPSSSWLDGQDSASQEFSTFDWSDELPDKPTLRREIGLWGTILFLGALVLVQTAINLLAIWSAPNV